MVKNSKLRKRVLFFTLLCLTFIINLPIITMVLNSFKTNTEILTSVTIFPRKFTLNNYLFLHEKTDFWVFFKNSIIIAGTATIASIIIAALAGYALSRFKTLFITFYSRSLLMLQMFPLILVLIPLFVLFRNIGLMNTPYSVMLLYISTHLPFAIWMYKGFFDSISIEMEEAAWIDGCSRFQSFYRIVLPISGPGIAAVAIFSFLFSWNEYLIANVFLRKESLYTIPVGIQQFMQQYSTDWASLMTASTLAMLPPFIFFLFVQKYMVYAAVGSSVKG